MLHKLINFLYPLTKTLILPASVLSGPQKSWKGGTALANQNALGQEIKWEGTKTEKDM